MKNTAIIIPSRLAARRFPNKPLVKINNVPIIIHVLNKAIEAEVGEVFVATPDVEIFNIVKNKIFRAYIMVPHYCFHFIAHWCIQLNNFAPGCSF